MRDFTIFDMICFMIGSLILGFILGSWWETRTGSSPYLQEVISSNQNTERDWQKVIHSEIGGVMEYRLPNGTRIDLMLPNRACEIDWAPKWAEGVGQATYYGLATSRPPLVILLAKKDGWEKYRDRVEKCGIECRVFDTRIEDWVE